MIRAIFWTNWCTFFKQHKRTTTCINLNNWNLLQLKEIIECWQSFGHDFIKLIFREVSSAKHRTKKTLELSSTEHNKFSDGIYRFRYSRFRNTFETHKMMSRTQANVFVLNSPLVVTLESNFQKSNPERKNRFPSVIVQMQREQTNKQMRIFLIPCRKN